MDDNQARSVQREASEVILDIGVSLPLKEWRIPFKKNPVRLRVTMRRPRLAALMCLTRVCLKMGVTSEEMERFTQEQQQRFILDHGKDISLVIAYTICQGPVARRLCARPVSWFLRECVEHRFQMAAYKKFVSLMGTDSFIGIIRSAERTNPMKLRLSQRKRS